MKCCIFLFLQTQAGPGGLQTLYDGLVRSAIYLAKLRHDLQTDPVRTYNEDNLNQALSVLAHGGWDGIAHREAGIYQVLNKKLFHPGGHHWDHYLGLSLSEVHDDLIKWKHFPRYWPFVRGIHRSPVNSPHKGQWRGTSMFSLIFAWTNVWPNNRDAGDLRRHRAHYDVTVMLLSVIWRSGSCRFHLKVPDRYMHCSDLTTRQSTRLIAPAMGVERHVLSNRWVSPRKT